MDYLPEWMQDLEIEDITFIKTFILSSGSLKDVAKEYDVSYPTVRLRLDRLIQKIRIHDSVDADPYIRLIKRLVVEEKIDYDAAKQLITVYRSRKED